MHLDAMAHPARRHRIADPKADTSDCILVPQVVELEGDANIARELHRDLVPQNLVIVPLRALVGRK